MAETNQRLAYGKTLAALCAENPDIVVLDADLGGSTMGKLVADRFPERHIEMGIAEANMISVAGGLSMVGKIPFASSFAVFAAGRAYDQIRQSVSIGRMNVKICGSSAGCSDFGDGASHQSVEDIAYMRAIPNMTVIVPADANETEGAVRYMAAHHGPMYLRLNRNDYENVTPEGAPFRLGAPAVLREGGEIVLMACGVMVPKALEAAAALAERVSVKVVNVSTIKPLDAAAVRRLVQGARGVVTAEEHSVIGGLGSTIAEILRRDRVPIEFVGIEDRFGSSAHDYESILRYLGLTTEHIIDAVRELAGV